jgi:hypothetical protein
MELIWLVLSLLAIDLAALLFAADSRPGLQHSSRPGLRQSSRPGLHYASRSGLLHGPRWAHRHANHG